MNIYLKSITLHHFLSFGESTISLEDRGFCLVSGINRNPKDAAKSNGSGKSTIWNAISYVLTGETLQGLKSNLGNIYYGDGCWVSLNFTIDGHDYTVLRSKEDSTYGTNLKITVDGVDKSGKGIKESEEILEQLLPDVTSELIGSVIILGQGMPQKFTNNTPAKRKEILEHLSKSDYMIQDLKERVEARAAVLNKQIRTSEDNVVSITSKVSVYNQQKEKAEAELVEAQKPTDYDTKIAELTKELEEVTTLETKNQETLKTLSGSAEELTTDFSKLSKEKQDALDKVRNEHDEVTKEYNVSVSTLNGKIMAIESEIIKLESIKDVCPTCGQKIPGAVKPDTSKQREELGKLKGELSALKKEIADDETEYRAVLVKIGEKFDSSIQEVKIKIDELNPKLREVNTTLYSLSSRKTSLSTELAKVTSAKENHEGNIKRITDNVKSLTESLQKLEEDGKTESETLTELKKHSEVIAKMSTFLKRDFRGFLLENVITYISNKAKEYCSQIFGSDEIVFALAGNNIDISYCGKDYENLSGGEKQRVDLIIQFAIRDMMCNYLGFNSNILVLDEITDNLDSVSCDKVLNFITKELSSVDSVFIISHHSDELEIPSDSEIVVEKNENGVSEAH